MLTAFAVSIAFLICYLVYHGIAGHVRNFLGPPVLGPSITQSSSPTSAGGHGAGPGRSDHLSGLSRPSGEAAPGRNGLFPSGFTSRSPASLIYLVLYHLYPAADYPVAPEALIIEDTSAGCRRSSMTRFLPSSPRRARGSSCAGRWFVPLATLAVVLVLSTAAWACPGCKDALNTGENGGDLRAGFFWSILFMLSMPPLILLGLGTAMYRSVCRGGRCPGSRPAAGSGSGRGSPCGPASRESRDRAPLGTTG